jgi:hypothetical protein
MPPDQATDPQDDAARDADTKKVADAKKSDGDALEGELSEEELNKASGGVMTANTGIRGGNTAYTFVTTVNTGIRGGTAPFTPRGGSSS